MKVLFDHQIFEAQKYGGISRYFCQIIQNFSNSITPILSVKYHKNHYLSQILNHKSSHPTSLNSSHNSLVKIILHFLLIIKRFFPLPFLIPYKINKFRTIQILKKGDFDIFHPTYYDNYFIPYLNGKPFVLTIHDMIHEIFPDILKEPRISKMKRDLALRANHIIAVSENTKNDIIRIYGLPKEKITVIHHGSPSKRMNTHQSIQLPSKFFLFIGERALYKNFSILLESIQNLMQSNQNIHLVCIGKQFNAQESQFIDERHLKSHVIQYEASDDELSFIYSKAIALVVPSLYEGFGIPLLEAFSANCPVIAANTSSLPEVGGDACLYFEPTNLDSIIACLNELANNPLKRSELIANGALRVQCFSWKNAAELTAETYSKCISNSI